jgi:hypothetical protein
MKLFTKDNKGTSVARDRNVCEKHLIKFEYCLLNLLTFYIDLNIVPIQILGYDDSFPA